MLRVNVLIESTETFEPELDQLSQAEKAIAIEKINECAAIFSEYQPGGYRNLQQIHLMSSLHEYDSSLHTLKISPTLGIVLTVDEDPIFDQVVLTLFRVVQSNHLPIAYHKIAESL